MMHFRYIERLEYILVSLSGVRSWVTAILVVPLMNYGKPCKYLILASHVLCISYNTGKSALPDIYARCPRASAYISGNARVPVL